MVECQVTMVECQEPTTYETPSLSSTRFHSNVSNLESKVDLQVKLRQWRGMMRVGRGSCRAMIMTGARRSSLVCSSLVFPSLCLPPSLPASHWLSVHKGRGDGWMGCIGACAACGAPHLLHLHVAQLPVRAPVDRLACDALSIFHVRVSS
jgi:hypothetical protein